MSAKEEYRADRASIEDDILILDLESESSAIRPEALGGEVNRIRPRPTPTSTRWIWSAPYGDERNPISRKPEFQLSLFE